MEISKHPKMGEIVSAIREIAKDQPCEDCKIHRDDLNAAKSRLQHWKDKYDRLVEGIENIIDDWTLQGFENRLDVLKTLIEHK